MTYICIWSLHAGRNPKNCYKEKKNPFNFCSFPFTRSGEMFCVGFFFYFLNEVEMNNVCYLFNNSCICSVPCLFPCLFVLLTWICRGGRNCYILRTVVKEQGRSRGRKRGKELLCLFFGWTSGVMLNNLYMPFQYEK